MSTFIDKYVFKYVYSGVMAFEKFQIYYQMNEQMKNVKFEILVK